MRKIGFLYSVMLLICVIGCSSTAPKQVSVEGLGSISIGYKSSVSSGYFVLIENQNDKWIIKNISNTPIKGRETSQQEILYLNESLTYVQPYFEKVRQYNGIWFECSLFEDKSSYTPCESQLTTADIGASLGKNIFAVITTAGLAAGTNKVIDREKIALIIKETSLLAKVREYQQAKDEDKNQCLKLQSLAQEGKDRIIVTPQIIDRSGFYAEDKIVNIHKQIKGSLSCPIDLDKVTYEISVNQADANFKINIAPNSYTLKYSSEGYQLNPLVTILSKSFTNVYPLYTNEDTALRIDFDGEKIRFTNKTTNFVQIKSISVYYNDEISNFNLGDRAIELPPVAKTKDPLSINNYVLDNVKKESNYLDLTISYASTRNISFGFAIKYRLVEQNVDRTLYKQNDYNLLHVLQSTNRINPSNL